MDYLYLEAILQINQRIEVFFHLSLDDLREFYSAAVSDVLDNVRISNDLVNVYKILLFAVYDIDDCFCHLK